MPFKEQDCLDFFPQKPKIARLLKKIQFMDTQCPLFLFFHPKNAKLLTLTLSKSQISDVLSQHVQRQGVGAGQL